MAKVVFMGTNGWFDSPTGNTVSTLLITNEFNIVLDAGNGISKLAGYLDEDKPTYLYISHFHLDHVEGLHTICLNRFSKGLTVIVQEGDEKFLKGLVTHPYTNSLDAMRFRSKIVETIGGLAELPFRAAFLPLQHFPVSQGIQIHVDGKSIAYCLDTGYCENAVNLAKDVDLLILECTLKHSDIGKNHLCPALCARIALESGAHRLALTHFEGKDYPDLKSREEAGEFVKKQYQNAFVCYDGMEIEL